MNAWLSCRTTSKFVGGCSAAGAACNGSTRPDTINGSRERNNFFIWLKIWEEGNLFCAIWLSNLRGEIVAAEVTRRKSLSGSGGGSPRYLGGYLAQCA